MSRKRSSPYTRRDSHSARARNEGYAARSVYKLQEIDQRARLFRAGQSVLDLGAFPGSWTQYAAKRVGTHGRVLGIDLQPFEGVLPPHARIVCGDLREDNQRPIAQDGPYDVVMSDMAPATTGQKHLDTYRSYELAMIALDIALEHLKPNGAFVAKIFQGEDFPAGKKRVQSAFAEAKVLRPKATRKESYEVFLFGRQPRGGAAAQEPDKA